MSKQAVLFTFLAVLTVFIFFSIAVLVIALNNKTVVDIEEIYTPIPTMLVEKGGKPRIIYTCTTYFELPNKWKAFKRGIRSLQEHHPTIREDIAKWYVVNEPSKTRNWAAKMRRHFPWIQFVQKSKRARGQAKSLNMILETIKPYDLWLQWEESWFATRPFLNEAVRYLGEGNLTQLQLTNTPPNPEPNWWHLSQPVQGTTAWRQVPFSNAMQEYVQQVKTGYDLTEDGVMHWPLFSLCPSLNVVDFHTKLPKFPTDPELWPWKFEYAFARYWALAGGKKGIFAEAPVTRDPAHKSTYG